MHRHSRCAHVPRSMSVAAVVTVLLMWAVGCGQREATVVRIYEYRMADGGSTLVAIQTPEGETLATYSQQARLRSQYYYSPYNPMQVTSVMSETYVMMDDGTESLGMVLTQLDPYGSPKTVHLIAPDSSTIGQYSFSTARDLGERFTQVIYGVLTSEVPCHRYVYDGKELVSALNVPEDCEGMEVGHRDSINVILSSDGESIRAILPRVRLRNGLQLYEVGFRFVDRLEGDSLLPYYWDLGLGQQRLTIYDIVPSFAREDFQKLALFTRDLTNYDDLVDMGNQQYDMGHLGEASRFYERARLIRDDSPSLLSDLGVCYMAADPRKALELFERAATMDPNLWQARVNAMMVLYNDLKDTVGARRQLEELKRLQAAVPDQLLADWEQKLANPGG